MNTKSGGMCPRFWSGLRGLFGGGVPPATPPAQPPTPAPSTDRDSLGHANGVDDDLPKGSNGAQKAGEDARDNASPSSLDETIGECPNCKVAIVVGHSSRSQGAKPPPMNVAEWTYNDDIAKRTVRLITQKSGGKIEAKIFYRVTGGGYTREMAKVYAQVTAFLAEVPSQKRIAIELHYNSVESSSARYSEVFYKGNVGFARSTAQQMAAVFGGKHHAKTWTVNPRGQGTFNNGPTNTYLMEPFFGSNRASADIAQTEDGKQQLAQIYATSLIDAVR